MKLHEEDFPIILFIHEILHGLDKALVILHLVEEVPDFKAIIESYIINDKDHLVGHTKP